MTPAPGPAAPAAPDTRPTSVQLADALAENARLRRFAAQVAELDGLHGAMRFRTRNDLVQAAMDALGGVA